MFAGVLAAPLLMLAMAQTLYADDAAPTTCKDGTTSSATGKGACSGHGGVQKAPKTAAAAPAPAAPAVNPSMTMTAATKTCRDGTTSAATGKGACSGHGGVQKAPAGTTSTTTPAPAAPTAATAPAPAASAASPAPAPTSAMTASSSAAAAKSSTATKSAPTATAGNTDPTGATAKCKDGTYSKSQHHSGTCSSHGGVAEWLTAAQ